MELVMIINIPMVCLLMLLDYQFIQAQDSHQYRYNNECDEGAQTDNEDGLEQGQQAFHRCSGFFIINISNFHQHFFQLSGFFTYLDQFKSKKVNDLKVTFDYKGKPQKFTALTDIIFLVK